MIRSPYREKGRELCEDASVENHALRNHMFCDQNDTGRVAQVQIDVVGQGSHAVAVQKFSGLLHQALR